MRISFDDRLRGRTVIDARGHAIGEVTAIHVDTDTWRVDALGLKLRNEIADRVGAPRGRFHAARVEVPVAWVHAVGDAVVLSVSAESLRPRSEPGEGQAAAPGVSEPDTRSAPPVE
jgi:sporulation protein YlmC with PRC-barrel domain